MHNIKLTIAYDGSNYLGWQKTKMGSSIEQALQAAIEQILQHPSPLQAASRTDAGVHAKGQVVNFLTSKALDLSSFMISLNSVIPKDIAVLNVEEMPLSFHPTLDCKAKEYRYSISVGSTQLPFERLYSWHIYHSLDLSLIKKAIPHFIGRKNFAAFCNVKNNEKYEDYHREVFSLEFNEEQLYFRIIGDHFLYKMVRNIVGTLVDIGKKKISPEDLPHILESGKRPLAGVTAPAHGLFLHRILYS